MNTSKTSTRPRFIDGFFDFFSSGFGHARRRDSNAFLVGLRHDPYGASVGSSHNSMGGHRLFTIDCTCSSPRVASSLHAIKGDLKTSLLNQQLHHANSHDKLGSSFTRVSKSWVPKYMLANPSGSKTQICLSPCV